MHRTSTCNLFIMVVMYVLNVPGTDDNSCCARVGKYKKVTCDGFIENPSLLENLDWLRVKSFETPL